MALKRMGIVDNYEVIQQSCSSIISYVICPYHCFIFRIFETIQLLLLESGALEA